MVRKTDTSTRAGQREHMGPNNDVVIDEQLKQQAARILEQLVALDHQYCGRVKSRSPELARVMSECSSMLAQLIHEDECSPRPLTICDDRETERNRARRAAV